MKTIFPNCSPDAISSKPLRASSSGNGIVVRQGTAAVNVAAPTVTFGVTNGTSGYGSQSGGKMTVNAGRLRLGANLGSSPTALPVDDLSQRAYRR